MDPEMAEILLSEYFHRHAWRYGCTHESWRATALYRAKEAAERGGPGAVLELMEMLRNPQPSEAREGGRGLGEDVGRTHLAKEADAIDLWLEHWNDPDTNRAECHDDDECENEGY
jgi:hypothetical protein